MQFADIGFLHGYLLKYRCVETKPVQRKVRRPGERQAADLLIGADPDELRDLQELLEAQGFELKEFNDIDMPGIPAGGRVWVLARSADAEAPSYLSVERTYHALRLRDAESKEAAAVWFLHIWLLLLALLYTRDGRAVSEVSKYQDTIFTRTALTEAVRTHVENIRNTGVEGGAEHRVVEILTSEKGTDIPRRVSAFLDLMHEAGLIIALERDEYQQTLLGAYEIAQGFRRSLAHIIPTDEILQNIVNIAAPESLGRFSPMTREGE